MSMPPVPPLPPEDHSCASCGITYDTTAIDDAVATVLATPAAARAAVEAIPQALLRVRSPAAGWSAVEYACHLRDAIMVYTLRLHRARTEHRPTVDPMLNDVRAARFRYNDSDAAGVLADMQRAALGLADEVAAYAPGEWDRLVERLPGETRTARWLVRQAMHEGVHHVRDMQRVARAAGRGDDPGGGSVLAATDAPARLRADGAG